MMFALPAILDQQTVIDLINPRYCPQDNTGFYTIDANINPLQDLVNYCPQDIGVYGNVVSGSPTVPSIMTTDTALWLDANDASTLTLESGAVSEWRDKSGNNRHATQTTASNRPLLVTGGLNGTDVIRFDGSDWLDCNTSLSLTAQHLFIVFKYNSTSGAYVRVFTYSDTGLDFNNSGHYIPILENNNNGILSSYFLSNFFSGLSIANEEVVLWENLHSGSQVSNYKNGRSVSSTVSNNTLNKTFTRFRIGGAIDNANTNNLNGDIAQIIIFPRVLTQAERELVEGYLAWSTRLEGNLPSNHPYKNSYPGITVTTTLVGNIYDFDQAP